MEHVVLVDEAGNPAGTLGKAAAHHDRTPLHLAFSCYLFDGSGRFLLTRRAAGKRVFPGVVTNSCCGHPAPGERLPDAVRRRAGQELGLEVRELTLVLPRFRYQAEMNGIRENELCPVYAARASGPVRPDPAEVGEAWWADWDQFLRQAADGSTPVSPWCALQLPELAALGPDPLRWPAASPADLPPAAR